jgi:hypothetical protein
MFEFKKKTGMSSMWNLAAQKQVCVSTDLRGYFVIDTLYYMHARARARARPRRRKSLFFSALVQPAADDGRLVAPREDGPDVGEDAAPVLCRRQHVKALPGCHREERWAVSGPQRGINCKEAFAYPRARRRPAEGPPKARRSRPRTLLWLSDGPVWSCGRPATPAMHSKSWRPATN